MKRLPHFLQMFVYSAIFVLPLLLLEMLCKESRYVNTICTGYLSICLRADLGMSTVSDLVSGAHQREAFKAGRIVSGVSPLFRMCSGIVPSSLCRHSPEDLCQGYAAETDIRSWTLFRSDGQTVSIKLREAPERADSL